MAASPVYPGSPNLGNGGVLLSTAMTSGKRLDGTDTLATTAFQTLIPTLAAALSLDSVTVNYSALVGTVPSGLTNAVVLRVWANNGSANTTAANNILIGTFNVGPCDYTKVDTAAIQSLDFPIRKGIPQGYSILVGLTGALGGTNAALSVHANASNA